MQATTATLLYTTEEQSAIKAVGAEGMIWGYTYRAGGSGNAPLSKVETYSAFAASNSCATDILTWCWVEYGYKRVTIFSVCVI